MRLEMPGKTYSNAALNAKATEVAFLNDVYRAPTL